MSATPSRTHRRKLGATLFLTLVAATSTGCANRAKPFDQMDKAQVTILKLQQAQAAVPQPGVAGLPTIPGLPPELQGAAQQTLQALQQQGLIPPGLIPGLGGAGGQTTQPTAQLTPYQYDQQWVIADQRPVVDDKLKNELLDIFGDADSFNDQRGTCWSPGMVVSFQSPSMPQPVDVAVSLSCNQAVGYGFQWPHPQSGLTPTTSQKLTGIYQSMFGPVPAGA